MIQGLETVWATLQVIRKNRGIHPEALARRIGVPTWKLRAWESGMKSPSLEETLHWAAALNACLNVTLEVNQEVTREANR